MDFYASQLFIGKEIRSYTHEKHRGDQVYSTRAEGSWTFNKMGAVGFAEVAFIDDNKAIDKSDKGIHFRINEASKNATTIYRISNNKPCPLFYCSLYRWHYFGSEQFN